MVLFHLFCTFNIWPPSVFLSLNLWQMLSWPYLPTRPKLTLVADVHFKVVVKDIGGNIYECISHYFLCSCQKHVTFICHPLAVPPPIPSPPSKILLPSLIFSASFASVQFKLNWLLTWSDLNVSRENVTPQIPSQTCTLSALYMLCKHGLVCVLHITDFSWILPFIWCPPTMGLTMWVKM